MMNVQQQRCDSVHQLFLLACRIVTFFSFCRISWPLLTFRSLCFVRQWYHWQNDRELKQPSRASERSLGHSLLLCHPHRLIIFHGSPRGCERRGGKKD